MSSRLYIGRIADGVKEEDLEKLLKECGKLRELDFKTGYAYVEYKDFKSAQQAVQTLNGKSLSGQSILVEHAKMNGTVGGYSIAGGYSAKSVKMPPPVRTAYRIRVENLSTRVKWMELKEFLNTAGEVTFADAHKRKAGEGIVEFASKEDMLKAIKQLDNNEFYGRRVRLVEEPIFGRPVSRSRSRSVSRTHRHNSRSRSKDRKRSRSNSRSKRSKRKSRSRSKEKSRSRRHRSRSKSPSKLRRRRSRSRSRSKERSKSPRRRKHKSKSKSPDREKSKKSKKKKKTRSESRSKSPESRKKKKKQSHKSDSESSGDSDNAENGK